PTYVSTLALHDALPIYGLSLLHSRDIHESPGELWKDSGGVEERARPWPPPRPPLVHDSRLGEQEIGPPFPPPLDYGQLVLGIFQDRKSTRLNSSHVSIS